MSNLEHKLRIFEIVILNTKWKKLRTQNCRRKIIKNLLPEENCPRTIVPWMIAHSDNYPEGGCLPENCPRNKITHTQVNFLQILRVNWGKLCMGYEYYKWRIVLPKVVFQGCKWFTSIKILATPPRTPLIREQLLVNVSRFS